MKGTKQRKSGKWPLGREQSRVPTLGRSSRMAKKKKRKSKKESKSKGNERRSRVVEERTKSI
jgi:hypothetical protein